APAARNHHGLVGSGNAVTKHGDAPQTTLSGSGCKGSTQALTSTDRVPRLLMTSTVAPRGIGSADQARYASEPPRPPGGAYPGPWAPPGAKGGKPEETNTGSAPAPNDAPP